MFLEGWVTSRGRIERSGGALPWPSPEGLVPWAHARRVGWTPVRVPGPDDNGGQQHEQHLRAWPSPVVPSAVRGPWRLLPRRP